MTASELIVELQKAIKRHGDREIYCAGEDYPGKVDCVSVQTHENAYTPKGAFKIHAQQY